MLLTLALVACKHPDPAPEELDELVGFLYEHIPDEEPDALAEGIMNLHPWVTEHLDETLQGYKVDDLSEEVITSLGDGEVDGNDFAGSAVGHESDRPVEDWTQALILEDQVEVYKGSYTEFNRDWDGNNKCFASRECLTMGAEVEAVSDYTLIKIVSHSANQFRWVETETGPALIYRTWLLEPAGVTPENIVSVERQYYLNVIFPTDAGTRTVQVTWAVAKLESIDTSEDFALQMLINGMAKNADKIDEWMDDNL